MNYRINLYTIEGECCFLTSVDNAGVEEFLEISTATKETNSQLRALFFVKFLLGNWSEKEQLDWLKVRIFHRAEKQIRA